MLRDSHDTPVTVETARERFGEQSTAAFIQSSEAMKALAWLITAKLKEIQQDCSNSNDSLALRIDGHRTSDALGADIADCISRHLETRGYSLAAVRDINGCIEIFSCVYDREENDSPAQYPLPYVSLSLGVDNRDVHEVLVHVRHDIIS